MTLCSLHDERTLGRENLARLEGLGLLPVEPQQDG